MFDKEPSPGYDYVDSLFELYQLGGFKGSVLTDVNFQKWCIMGSDILCGVSGETKNRYWCASFDVFYVVCLCPLVA